MSLLPSMTEWSLHSDRGEAAFRRLSALAPLQENDVAILNQAARTAQSSPARHDLQIRLHLTGDPVLILDGWAHRSCLLADGRRQITGVLLPGDILLSTGLSGRVHATITAITTVSYCTLPRAEIETNAGLTQALDANRAVEEDQLRRQIVRLGALDALERIVDWLLELYERQKACGTASGDTMALPLTQEMMADALGLTSVHVNRMLSVLRREKLVTVQNGRAVFLNRDRCRSMVGDL
jgi:CRP-like cAMP-binding protein